MNGMPTSQCGLETIRILLPHNNLYLLLEQLMHCVNLYQYNLDVLEHGPFPFECPNTKFTSSVTLTFNAVLYLLYTFMVAYGFTPLGDLNNIFNSI